MHLSLCMHIYKFMCQCIFTYNDIIIVYFCSLRCVSSPLAGLLKSPKAKCSRNYISPWSKLGFWDPGEALFYQLPKICGIQSSARTTKARPKHPAERPKTVSPRHRASFVIPKQGCGKNILRDWERLSTHIYGILGWSMLVWSHVSCIWLQCGIHTRRIPALCEIYCKSSGTVPKRSFTFHSYKEVGVIEWKIDIFPDLKGSSTFWLLGFHVSRKQVAVHWFLDETTE